MKLRRILVIVLLAVLVLGSCSRQKASLKGTVLSPPQPASDFTLLDQHGVPFHLADAKGKVVLLSFIYTACTDICPFITVKVKKTQEILGKDADNVVFVAMTTDPTRDTLKTIADYSQMAGLFDAWHYVTGSPEEMKAVWSSWGIGVHVQSEDAEEKETGHSDSHSHTDSHSHSHADEEHAETPSSAGPTQGLGSADLLVIGELIDRFGGGYEVSHSAPWWFVDKAGRVRAVMDVDALPSDIADNIRQLSTER
jgi:cytochrome oxidase Cu insertion factor (SCO1/SenC/PrrC family)